MRYLLGVMLAVMFVVLSGTTSGQPPKKDGKGKGGPGGGTAATPEASAARLMVYDTNGDGKLSKEEITDSRLQPLLERADVNKDGFVTKEELIALFTKEASAAPMGKGGPPPK